MSAFLAWRSALPRTADATGRGPPRPVVTQLEHWRTALVLGHRGKRRALPSRIGLYIAVDSPNGYSDVKNLRSSWKCRFGPTRCDDVTKIKRAVALREGANCAGEEKGEPKWWVTS